MILYMIRHGESEANIGGFYGGWDPVPLTERGRAQAVRVGEKLQALPIRRVLTSDVARAVQTCALALPGRAYETCELLREISVGSLAGQDKTECARRYGEEYLRRIREQDYTAYGGENRELLTARAACFFAYAETLPEDTVAAFTHEQLMKAAFRRVTGGPWPGERLLCANTCVAAFERTGSGWRLIGWNI